MLSRSKIGGTFCLQHSSCAGLWSQRSHTARSNNFAPENLLASIASLSTLSFDGRSGVILVFLVASDVLPMTFNSDQWIATNSPIDAQRLHALGAVIVHWNDCEKQLFILFGEMLGLPLKEVWVIAHDLGNIAICTKIKALARAKNFSSAFQSAIENTLEVYDICLQNRNQLVHFWTSGLSGDRQLYRKSKKADYTTPELFKSDLADIRRVAEDIKALAYQMSGLEAAINTTGRGPPNSPLPSKLALPARLYSPPPQAPTKQKQKPRRPSSQA